MKHVNAGEVLPERLLREVQRYCTGYIYVPVTRELYKKRRREILRLSRRGLSTWAIAGQFHLSERRVRQILAEERGRK